MRRLLKAHAESPNALKHSIDELRQEAPPPLAARFVHLDSATVIAGHISRFT